MDATTEARPALFEFRLREVRDDLEHVAEAISTLREIAHEHVPDDASEQLKYIVKIAADAVESL